MYFKNPSVFIIRENFSIQKCDITIKVQTLFQKTTGDVQADDDNTNLLTAENPEDQEE